MPFEERNWKRGFYFSDFIKRKANSPTGHLMPRLKCSFGAITYIRVTRRNRKGTLGLVRLRLYEWWTNYGVTIRLRYKSKHSCGPHGTFILLRSEPSQPVNVCESMLSQIISLADLLNSQDLEWRFYSEHFPSYPHVSTHRLRRPNVAASICRELLHQCHHDLPSIRRWPLILP